MKARIKESSCSLSSTFVPLVGFTCVCMDIEKQKMMLQHREEAGGTRPPLPSPRCAWADGNATNVIYFQLVMYRWVQSPLLPPSFLSNVCLRFHFPAPRPKQAQASWCECGDGNIPPKPLRVPNPVSDVQDRLRSFK